jgi:tetratricopeptide (TPR) repeat protein
VRNDLSGTVRGPVIQAGAVYGDIHLAGRPDRDRDVAPWQLPPAVKIIDRARETRALDGFRKRAAEEGRPTVIAVSGLGGVGKSVLSLSWLHRIRPDCPDGQLYADLGSVHGPEGPADPSEVLSRFLRGLGVPPERAAGVFAEKVGLYRSLTAKRRLVVLLDNAVTAAQVRPLLPSGSNVAVVTSRWRLPGLVVDGCFPLHLEPLDIEDAVELLQFTLADGRVAAQPHEARELVALCAGLPLAVRVAGARLAARPRRPITAMVLALQEERSRLNTLAIEGDHNVRAALDLSYHGLSEPARRLYRLLGLHPGPQFGEGVARAVFGGPPGAAGAEGHDITDLLDRLLDANLLSDPGEDRYRFHDLVRLHAAGRAEEEEPELARAAAVDRVLDYYLASAASAELVLDPHHQTLPRDVRSTPPHGEDFAGDEERALRWLEEEQDNLLSAVKQARRAGRPALTWQLTDAMWSLFTRRKHYGMWRAAHEEGLLAARECGDVAGQCRMLTSGGLGELDTGGHERAIGMFDEAAVLLRDQGDDLGHARTFNYLGLAYRGLGRLDEAMRLFEQAAELCPRFGDVRAGGLARLNLADVALALLDHQDARAHAAAAQLTLLTEGDPYNAARAGTLLGRAQLGCGRPDEAQEQLEAALAVLTAMAAGFETAHALEGLAEVARSTGHTERARVRYQEALDLYTDLGVPAAQEVRTRLESLP